MGHYDCKHCDASPHEEHAPDCGRMGAVASLRQGSGQTFDSPGADRQGVQCRIDQIRDWVESGCAEGVSGVPENVSWLLDTVEDLTRTDFKKRASDAITLLYTFGIITEKMRAHARRMLG